MIKRIKSVLRSDLIKISSKTGIATAVRIAASFIVSKVLAIFVGPSGLAIMGHLNNVGNILQSLSTGGITVGVTKYVAEYADDKKQQDKVINASLKIIFICSSICTVLVLISFKYLGAYFFNTSAYDSVLFLLGLTLVLFSFNSLFIAILNGFKKYKLYITINIATSIISLLLTVGLVYQFGVYGALLSFVLSPAMVFFLSWYMVRNEQWLSLDFLRVKTDRKSVKLLGSFSLMVINNAVVGAVAQILVRFFLTGNMDIVAAGIWDGMNRLSAAYLLFLTASIQVYYLPTLAFIKDNKLLWKEILRTERIILPLALVIFIFIFLFRGFIIDVLFTKEFYLMKSVFALQLIGDLIKIASWLISYTMYAKAMVKNLIITDNLFTFFYVLVSYLFLTQSHLGLSSVYYAYILNNLIYLVFIYFFMKKHLAK